MAKHRCVVQLVLYVICLVAMYYGFVILLFCYSLLVV
jgi:hypothetical protein